MSPTCSVLHVVSSHVVLEDDGDAVHGTQAGRSLGVFALDGIRHILRSCHLVEDGIHLHDGIHGISGLQSISWYRPAE